MIGWIDGQAGASGDMLLGALVDAGVPLTVLQSAVDELGLGIELTVATVTRAGIGATKVDVVANDDGVGRTWSDVRALLPDGRAHEVFARLAESEAAAHRVPVDDVHFHEVGAHDALADVVGVCAGLAHLGLERLHCSPLALGSGQTRGAHGPVPVPGPAVLALLTGLPVEAGRAPMELTTPTGAALLATHVTDWGPLPAMTVARVGTGAGGRDPAELANVLRLVLGRPSSPGAAVLLETNVDDLDPRLWPQVLSQLLGAGASDAWLTPILMKKGRPAHTLSVLASSDKVPALRAVVFAETSTLGLRELVVGRHVLERAFTTVLVEGQPIRVKTGSDGGVVVNATPEWEDVLAAAQVLGRPAKQVLAEAISAYGQTSVK